MINSEPLPIMNQMISNRIPQNYNQYQQYSQQPTTRLTLEQQAYQQPYQQIQQTQSDPYTDYLSVLSSCTDITREKMLQDERYVQIYAQCELALKQTLYAQVIPQVLQTPQGRILFEQLYNISKSLKEEYTQKDIQKEKQLEALMNDPVVMQRLIEIQSGRTIPQQQQQQPQQQRVEPASSSTPTNNNHQNNKNNQQKYQQNKSQPGDTLE